MLAETGGKRDKAMRILIDSRVLYGSKSGIGYYLNHLLYALAAIDTENFYTLFYVSGRANPGKITSLPSPNFRTEVLRFPNPVFVRVFRDWFPAYQWARTLSRRYDLVHEPGYEPLPFAPRSVVTIHDMILFRQAQDYPPRFAARYQRRIRESARNASLIIADSEQTRRDILALLDVPPEKVVTILLGVDLSSFAVSIPPDQAQRLRKALGITQPFLVSIGDLYRRKNNITLVQAWARLPHDICMTHQLVIAGAPQETTVLAELQAEIAALGLEEQVLLAGYVSEETRKFLLSHAQALLYPSLYEGFGLPPLEAMACGTPTVSSNNSSIPEVVGNAGLLVTDYTEPDAWAQAIVQIVTDGGLRRQYTENGYARVQLFPWEETARQTLGVYERAVQM